MLSEDLDSILLLLLLDGDALDAAVIVAATAVAEATAAAILLTDAVVKAPFESVLNNFLSCEPDLDNLPV